MHRPKNVDENQKKNETLASQNKQKSKPISQIMKKKKEIKDQLNTPLETLRQDAPIEPNWGIKKNSDGKNTFWFGFKGHLAVTTKSQYIVGCLMTSANLSDSKYQMSAVIPYNVQNEGEYLGFDEHFRLTCVREHSYCYDSFDEKYRTLTFTRPKECVTCSLRDDSLCQKVFKIKCDTDIRKFTYPARGSELWKQL